MTIKPTNMQWSSHYIQHAIWQAAEYWYIAQHKRTADTSHTTKLYEKLKWKVLEILSIRNKIIT